MHTSTACIVTMKGIFSKAIITLTFDSVLMICLGEYIILFDVCSHDHFHIYKDFTEFSNVYSEGLITFLCG